MNWRNGLAWCFVLLTQVACAAYFGEPVVADVDRAFKHRVSK